MLIQPVFSPKTSKLTLQQLLRSTSYIDPRESRGIRLLSIVRSSKSSARSNRIACPIRSEIQKISSSPATVRWSWLFCRPRSFGLENHLPNGMSSQGTIFDTVGSLYVTASLYESLMRNKMVLKSAAQAMSPIVVGIRDMNILDRIVLIGECEDVIVNTYGVDGNALSIIGACRRAMKDAGVSKRARDVFFTEATSGDYENVLKTANTWCNLVHIVPRDTRGGSFIGSLREADLDPEIQA